MNQLTALYESDFYSWALQNAELIKLGRFEELDTEHLAEEIESMGASEKRALESRLIELMLHLLKYQFQPERKGSSWEISINKQRVAIERILRNNPSLNYQLDERVVDCYRDARRYAAIETQLPLTGFPENCPYNLEQLADFEFMPN
jgi:hypothetical protein